MRGGTLELAVQDDGPGLPAGVRAGATAAASASATPANGCAVLYRRAAEHRGCAYCRMRAAACGIEITPAVRTGRASDMTHSHPHRRRRSLARRGLELRLRDEPDVEIVAQVRQRSRGDRGDRRSTRPTSCSSTSRCRAVGSRRAGAGAAGKHADDRVRHRVRSLRDRRVRGARARLPAEAGRRRAPRVGARSRACAVAPARRRWRNASS